MDKKVTRVAAIFLGLFFVAFSLHAQDLNDAKREIKKGDLQKRSNEYETAIQSYSNCVNIIKDLGAGADEEAVELMAAAEKKWVKTHLDYANELLKQDKYDQALDHYNKVIDLGKQYQQDDYVEKAENNVPKVWYAKGKAQLSSKNFEDAITYLDKAIEFDPEYGWAYIRKAQVYMSTGDDAKLEQAVKEAISIGENSNQSNVVKTAEQVGYKYFYNKGATALKGKDYKTAAENLQKAVNYNGSATIYHYLALSYGQIGEFQKAIENEKTAIDMMKKEKSEEEMAKYYYALAGYYKEVGENSNACDAFKNAAFGQYKANAEYQIKHILKCN
jgi:tetratricopeptide (TPR) repeat protein